MDPINPWLDPVEVRRMAERLMRPDRAAAAPPTEAGFGEGFEGFAESPATAREPVSPPTHSPAPPAEPLPEPVVAVQTTPPRELSRAAEEPEPAPAPAPAPAPPDVPPPLPPAQQQTSARGPFLGRIQAFRQWMQTNFGASGLFILDREGAVIFDEGSHGRLHFLARSLAMASRRPGSSTRNVHVKIGAGATLEVIPVDTPFGCLVLGAVVPEALDAGAVSTVMDALVKTASPNRGN